MEELLKFIKEHFMKTSLKPEEIFMKGNCGNLYFIFADEFPGQITPYGIYYNGKLYHVVTSFSNNPGVFYDINGETSIEAFCEFLQRQNSRENFEIGDFTIEPISEDVVKRHCDGYWDYEHNESLVLVYMDELKQALMRRRKIKQTNKAINDIPETHSPQEL